MMQDKADPEQKGDSETLCKYHEAVKFLKTAHESCGSSGST